MSILLIIICLCCVLILCWRKKRARRGERQQYSDAVVDATNQDGPAPVDTEAIDISDQDGSPPVDICDQDGNSSFDAEDAARSRSQPRDASLVNNPQQQRTRNASVAFNPRQPRERWARAFRSFRYSLALRRESNAVGSSSLHRGSTVTGRLSSFRRTAFGSLFSFRRASSALGRIPSFRRDSTGAPQAATPFWRFSSARASMPTTRGMGSILEVDEGAATEARRDSTQYESATPPRIHVLSPNDI